MELIQKPSGERRRKAALPTAVAANWSTVSRNIGFSGSVDVFVVAALGGEPREIGLGCGGLHMPLLAEDVGEPRLDIARHALRVTADIKMRALFEPRPQLTGMLEQPMLDVDLVFLVAREGGVEPG